MCREDDRFSGSELPNSFYAIDIRAIKLLPIFRSGERQIYPWGNAVCDEGTDHH
jgi:hypothetical protein